MMPDREKLIRALTFCCYDIHDGDCNPDCPYYDACSVGSPVPTVMYDVLALLKEQRWIPVTEQYPEERKAVLVYQRMYKNTYCAFLDGMDWWIYGGYGTKAFGITHWMPLPEPPKGEDDEGC